MKLSDTMLDVVAKMRAAGGRLERWPGGFWTTPGMAVKSISQGYRIPVWSTSTHTVKALAARGVIAADAEQPTSTGSFIVGYRLVS